MKFVEPKIVVVNYTTENFAALADNQGSGEGETI